MSPALRESNGPRRIDGKLAGFTSERPSNVTDNA